MKNKYKILVLSDLKNSTRDILKSTISMSKMMNAEIELLHIKRPHDVVVRENQLSALRSINSEFHKTNLKTKELVDSINLEYDTSIKVNFEMGNTKSEIKKYVKKNNPHIIVLGKRKNNPLQLVGDGITQFVLKIHRGPILIASGKQGIEPNKDISLGILNQTETFFQLDIEKELIAKTQKPPPSFKIMKNIHLQDKLQNEKRSKNVEYVFERTESALKNLSSYIRKSNVNLLCVQRDSASHRFTSDINKIIENLDVSLFVSSKTS